MSNICLIFNNVKNSLLPSCSHSKNWILGVCLGEGSFWRGTPKLCQSICSLISTDIIKHWHPSLSCSKNWFLGVCLWGIPGGLAPPNYVKIFVCWISADINTNWHPSLSCSKNWFLGGLFEGVPGGWHPKTISKYFSIKYLLISKQTGTLAWAVQKIDIWGSIWADTRRGGTPKLCQNICLLNIGWYHKTLAP